VRVYKVFAVSAVLYEVKLGSERQNMMHRFICWYEICVKGCSHLDSVNDDVRKVLSIFSLKEGVSLPGEKCYSIYINIRRS